ncbi:vegetative cell wall protein gp1-like [Actinia tenebrosa]|uniref:Vegetative cell wall protein gp1-like n=1 Tax=Actinia tenebrosa TaxID=6105 RepID=A0A6P8IXX8_ACTTE|nr:vegetative cell wall protein gp1-like [Actinia tenebrosa]
MQQQQHPAGRQVGGRIYYGSYHGREVQCKKCLMVAFTILFILIGVIVTIVGHTLEPFWPESHSSFCSFCEEDNNTTRRNAANCRIVGPIFITIGFLLLVFTVVYFKKKNSEALAANGNSNYYGEPAPTTLAYNQAGQSVNVPYPGTGHIQPSCPQPPYPPTQPQYPASQPYPSGTPNYSTAPQPYPTAPQSGTPYPPYPETTQDNLPPPPAYDTVVGSEGIGEKKQ